MRHFASGLANFHGCLPLPGAARPQAKLHAHLETLQFHYHSHDDAIILVPENRLTVTRCKQNVQNCACADAAWGAYTIHGEGHWHDGKCLCRKRDRALLPVTAVQCPSLNNRNGAALVGREVHSLLQLAWIHPDVFNRFQHTRNLGIRLKVGILLEIQHAGMNIKSLLHAL